MYSTVSAGVLALDLARHPAGGALADLIDRTLVLTPADLVSLGRAAAGVDRGPARRRLLGVASQAPRLADGLTDVAARLAAALGSTEASDRHASERTATELTATELAGRLVGSLPDLHALLLDESPLAHADTDAIGVVLDAVTAVWLQHDPSAAVSDVRLLGDPWARAISPFPSQTPDVGVAGVTSSLLSLLDAIASTGVEQWLELDQAHEAMYDGLDWSVAMHAGCRAAVESGRTLPVARWLLAAARTAHGTGLSQQGVAPGAMMSIVAAVQATCVRDLLPEATAATLTGACRAVLGWSG